MQITLYGSIAWRHPFGMGQVIEWAGRYGWDAVDARGLSLDAPGDPSLRHSAFGYDMLGPRNLQASARHALRHRLLDAGVELLGIYCSSPVNLPGERGSECRRLFCDYLKLASDLGATWVRAINNTRSTYEDVEMSTTEAYDRTVEGLKYVGARAADLGVGLLIENNENTIPSDATSLVRLKSDLGSACRVGVTYDPVNAYFQGANVEAGFDALDGAIDVLHVKNVRRHTERRWDYVPRGDVSYEWTCLDGGDLDWKVLMQRARAAKFDGPVVYEYVNPFKGMPLSYWDSLPEPEEAARDAAEFLRQV